MLGFAVVDAVPKGESVAVWLTSLVEPQRASHVNAVVIAREDPDLVRKVRALCGDRAVVLTDISNTDGLGIDAAALGPDALQVLAAETTEHRARIIDAVTEYGRRTGTRPTLPEFPGQATRDEGPLPEDSAPARALSAATRLARAWTGWLQAEEQRRRRAVRADGGGPWMMPPELSNPAAAPLPPRFAELAQAAVLVGARRA